MTKDIFAVAPDTSLETAARMLASKEITGAPVVDDEGETVGVISLVDLVDPDNQASDEPGYSTFYRISDGWAMTKGEPKTPRPGRVSDVMTPATLTTTEDTTVLEATKLMLEYRVHRLLVENDGRLTGIVSTMDLLRGFVADQ
jgi:CBS domain-containing protein